MVKNQINAVSKKVIISLVTVLSVGQFALAKDRYLVVYKSQQGFKAMNNYMLSVESAGNSVKLQKSLKHINAMVLKSKSANAIEALKNHPEVELIEKETFSPAPKPVNGFKISKVQTFNNEDAPVVDQPVADVPVVDQPVVADDVVVQVPNFQEGYATPWGINAVRAPQAWAASHAGAKARVLVLDTGIDPNHPALKANFEKGQNFFEGENGLDPADFIDKEGHGTHCAGTIAAAYNEESGFTGVAPLAKILMGRVCGEMGCSNIAVAEGINWGIQEKVDVISMSLGGPYGSSIEKNAVANAEKAGVVVIAASGNSGTPKVSFPAAFPTVVAVGAVDSSITKTNFSQWGPELDVMGPGAAVMSSVPRGTGRDSHVFIVVAGDRKKVKSAAFSGTKLFSTPRVGDLVPAGLGKKEDFTNINVAGKIALISRGEIAFSEKIQNALAAKAVGVVIYNNTTGLMQGSATADGSEIDAAVVMIEKTLGLELVAAIKEGKASSAEISTAASDYAMFDGTSMATPHVAGVAALIKSANKKLTPAQVRTILTSTAQAMLPNDQNQNGSGLVQAEKAVLTAVQTVVE